MTKRTDGRANGEDKVFVAVMNTEHFEFHAVGRTRGEAEEAIARKFNELATEHMTRKELDDWYGISTDELGMGDCVRI